jgi:two-component system sensor histidine kinase KdpD
VGAGWERDAADGDAPETPEAADLRREVGPGYVLALRGGPLRASDLRVLAALTGQLATAVEARRLQDEADQAEELRQANDLRSALLQAVSHDLRSPLAGIKASVSSLRADEVAWTPEEEAEFLRTIEDETDRLDGLVANLLDMSRIQAGAVRPELRVVALDEVVPAVLVGAGDAGARIAVDVPETLPPVRTDPVLFERVVANLVDNALKASPDGSPVEVEAVAADGQVVLRVVDHGCGIPTGDRDRVFAPVQRTTDHGAGVGLGLAIVRGFAEAIGADLLVEDTAGGGATMTVRLPVAR